MFPSNRATQPVLTPYSFFKAHIFSLEIFPPLPGHSGFFVAWGFVDATCMSGKMVKELQGIHESLNSVIQAWPSIRGAGRLARGGRWCTKKKSNFPQVPPRGATQPGLWVWRASFLFRLIR
ncbi:hypothetical protein QTO34_006674 [Cnephaeus nilssonii]|uniref:Uncharacterized protein n=1 Tax=Cnephaeus nilssonii TaxID=3371016 RepID=A0AA40LI58_CNENI|nr:hypothetical protein QTO34_006674 [Eptesicus nilssonii]